MSDILWRLRLLGGLEACGPGGRVERFRRSAAAELLGYLALHLGSRYDREVLQELLWPECDSERGSNRLSVALSSLRRQLEPPVVPVGAVLVTPRQGGVCLNPEAVCTDVRAFHDALDAAGRTPDLSMRIRHLQAADEAYGGVLLPCVQHEWVEEDRQRLAERRVVGLRALGEALAAAGDTEGAIDCLHRAIEAAPAEEPLHAALIRVYLAAGRAADAVRQYRRLEHALRRDLDCAPSLETRRLVAALLRAARRRRMAGAGPDDSRPLKRAGSPPARQKGVRQMGRASGAPDEAGDVVGGEGAAPRPPEGPRPRVSLPPIYDRFFGREAESDLLQGLLGPHGSRLVTITGPAGGGKTRLAVEAAGRCAGRGDTSALFVPLAEVRDPVGIAGAVERSLQLPDEPGRALSERLVAVAGGAPVILVLDNFEQLMPHGASVVASLLAAAPGITCLVTSRRPLELPGERELTLPPLPVPPAPGPPAAMLEFAAVRLFVDRAQSRRADFQITPRNAAVVTEICARLDGLPLAIELAAARAGALPPARILEMMAQGLDALDAPVHKRGPRHTSLRAALDWSFQDLPPTLQRLFARLSVFPDGWSPEAAAEVCEYGTAGPRGCGALRVSGCGRASRPGTPNGGTTDAAAAPVPASAHAHSPILSALCELHSRSLIVIDDCDGEMRCRLLQSTREYAAGNLDPDEAADLAARHAAYYADLGVRGAPELKGPEQAAWLSRLQAEEDNLRGALGWLTAHDAAGLLRLAGALPRYWRMCGRLSEGREWLERAAAASRGEPTRQLAAVLNGIGMLAAEQGEDEAARHSYEWARAMCHSAGDRPGEAACLSNLAELRDRAGEHAAAAALYEESLAALPPEEFAVPVAQTLCSLALVRMQQGDTAEAHACMERALAIHRKRGNGWGVAVTTHNLGELEMRCGRPERAFPRVREAMGLFRRLRAPGEVAASLETLGTIFKHGGRYETAALLLGAAAAARDAQGATLEPSEAERHGADVGAVRQALGEDAFTAAWHQGVRLTLDEAVLFALELEW